MTSKDKICLITGASSGIGKAAAALFADAGAELILIARNRYRGEKAVEDITRKSGNKNIKLFIADLSSWAEIKELSDRLHNSYGRIDVLVNNAGAYYSKFHLTIDDVEASFDVNYVARFLLTNRLLDLLLNSGSGRIIEITGEYHRKGELDFSIKENINFSPFKAASNAKFADMLFSMELSRRLRNYGVTVNTMHPGTVATNLIYSDPDASWYSKIAYSILRFFFRNPDKAGREIFNLAFSEEVKELTGKYFCCGKLKEPSPHVHNEQLAASLWKFTEELTGYSNPIFNKNKLTLEK